MAIFDTHLKSPYAEAMERYITAQVRADLARKMVFIGGPRQVGKTTFASTLLPKSQITYLNWDVDADRTRIIDGDLGDAPLLVLDELHKYRRWRGLLKGTYDLMQVGRIPRREILVTGSARLDLYRHGGDSLQGRYHYIRMLPLTVAELGEPASFETLMRLSGFPEPFFGGSEREARRWSREYRARIVRDDIGSLERVEDLARLELLVGRLPALVGAPLSINALSEDLQAAHRTVAKWLDIVERIYGMFRLAPLSGPKIRAVKKERKHYLFDWSVIESEEARFENLVAVHLLKYCFFHEDSEGEDFELRYFRDRSGREVDFVVTKRGQPVLLVECKLGDQNLSASLQYLHTKYPSAQGWQIHARGKENRQTRTGIRIAPASQLLAHLV